MGAKRHLVSPPNDVHTRCKARLMVLWVVCALCLLPKKVSWCPCGFLPCTGETHASQARPRSPLASRTALHSANGLPTPFLEFRWTEMGRPLRPCQGARAPHDGLRPLVAKVVVHPRPRVICPCPLCLVLAPALSPPFTCQLVRWGCVGHLGRPPCTHQHPPHRHTHTPQHRLRAAA